MSEWGKWSEAGVPHTGWECVRIEDLGEPSLICEMCERAEVRYVHMMQNERWPNGVLKVGCHCAGRMEEDFKGAEEREAKFKKWLRVKRKEEEREEVAKSREAIAKRREEIAKSWIEAAHKLLQCGGLRESEREFVTDIWARFIANSEYRLTQRQMDWFKAIYLKRFPQERRQASEVAAGG